MSNGRRRALSERLCLSAPARPRDPNPSRRECLLPIFEENKMKNGRSILLDELAKHLREQKQKRIIWTKEVDIDGPKTVPGKDGNYPDRKLRRVLNKVAAMPFYVGGMKERKIVRQKVDGSISYGIER